MFWRAMSGYLPNNLFQGLLGFGSIVVLTRLLSPSEYGAYALAISVVTLVNLCLFTWIEAALARFYVAYDDDQRPDLMATLYRTAGAVALALPAAILVVWLLPLGGGLKAAICTGLAAATVQMLLRLGQERRKAMGEVRAVANVEMLQVSAAFVLAALFALAGMGPAAPFAATGAASAACLVWSLPRDLRLARGRFDKALLARASRYGVPLSMSLLLGLAISSVDRFVIAAYVGETSVGAYHAGYALANRTLEILFLWLGVAGQPACIAALERGGMEALTRTARLQASSMVMICLPASVGLALVAQPLAHLMIGHGLAETAAQVTPWIAAGAFISGVTIQYLNTAFTLSNSTPRLVVAFAVPALANLLLTLLLIPRYGLAGAMWAMVASYGLGAVTSYVLGRRRLRLPIPWRALATAGTASTVMALVVSRLPATGDIWELGLKAAVGAVVYALVMVLFHARLAQSTLAGLLKRHAVTGPSPVPSDLG